MSNGKAGGLAILRVQMDDAVVAAVTKEELPTERRSVVALRSESKLEFVASDGLVRVFALGSLYEEGERFLHLSIRVGGGFAVQVDALLSTDGADPQPDFAEGKGRGIRFQPFFLPERGGPPVDLEGRGLFTRGLHFGGNVTPSNVSLVCNCEQCARTFRLRSFHAGFASVEYFYCSRHPHTLVTSTRVPTSDPEALARFENQLPPCEECGGDFRYLNPLRCPHCGTPFIDFQRYPEERAGEYYGNVLYDGSPQRWEPARA